jgi:hypothetical protein
MEKNKSAFLTYIKLIAILLIPIIYITLYSFCDKDITCGDLTLEKTDIADYFRKKPISVSFLPVEEDSIRENKEIICDTTTQRILFFGDSMLEGLSRRMKQYAAENHHELLSVIWYSSSTKVWSEHKDTLIHFIKTFHPTYIMICMGGNELFIRDLDKRDAYVKEILKTIGTTPYVWIGPPNWKTDTGINAVFEKNVGIHRFFPSKRLKYERGKDGAHPTYASAAMWMDSVACWMNDSINHRIAMHFPKDNNQRSGKIVLLSPLK